MPQRAQHPVERLPVPVRAPVETDCYVGVRGRVRLLERQRGRGGPPPKGAGEDGLEDGAVDGDVGGGGDGVLEVAAPEGPSRSVREVGVQVASREGRGAVDEVSDAAARGHELVDGRLVDLAGGVEAEEPLVGPDGDLKCVVEGVGGVRRRSREVAEVLEIMLEAGEAGLVVAAVAAGEVPEGEPGVNGGRRRREEEGGGRKR